LPPIVCFKFNHLRGSVSMWSLKTSAYVDIRQTGSSLGFGTELVCSKTSLRNGVEYLATGSFCLN